MTESTRFWLWLTTVEGITHAKVARLIQKFHRPELVYRAEKDDYQQVSGMDETVLKGLMDKSMLRVDELMAQCERKGIGVMTCDDACYPRKLHAIAAKPFVLYYAGTLMDVDEALTIGMIGARKASPYGLECAERLSADLTRRGAIVVSGMAEGIDGAANKAALKAGGTTIAVVGCGLDVVYPKFHRDLMMHIIRNGLLISEYPPGTRPLPYHFPARNRIISGLSNGLVVVEAAKKSGSRITVEFALEQGRDVFVVPGSIFSHNSVGVLDLMKDGAIPVTCAEDILLEYPLYNLTAAEEQGSAQTAVSAADVVPAKENAASDSEDKNADVAHIIDTDAKYGGLGDTEKKILKCMHFEPESFDGICARSGVPAAELSAKLSMLCVLGLAEQHPFGRYSLK